MICLSDMNYQEAIHAVTTPDTNYFDRILTRSRWWVKGAKGQEFTSEQMRIIFEATYASALPAEPRVYGAVIKELHKEGLLEKAGYTTSTNPQAHHRPINVWKVK